MTPVMEKLMCLFPTEKNRQNFVAMATLTYGLTKESLGSMLGISPDEVCTNYIYSSPVAKSVTRRWHHIYNSQEEAIMNFGNILERLYEAYLRRDGEAFKEILKEVTDRDAARIIKEKERARQLTDDDIVVILKYQIKYAITSTETANIFHMQRTTYGSRLKKVLDIYPEFVEPYRSLTATNTQNSLDYTKGRC